MRLCGKLYQNIHILVLCECLKFPKIDINWIKTMKKQRKNKKNIA